MLGGDTSENPSAPPAGGRQDMVAKGLQFPFLALSPSSLSRLPSPS